MMIRILLLAAMLIGTAANAQTRRPSHCLAIADAADGIAYLQRAAFTDPVAQHKLRITYIDHAMFLIQTHGGLSVVTDYSGFVGGDGFLPDVVTMNHAHDTHWTMFPNPDIPHVLKGWGKSPAGADHHLDLGEMLIRNVPTDIRGRFGGPPEINGNSIFVFEAAGLCVGHLGHLHHEPTAEQYAALGRVDVVMAAVDGGMTLRTDTMVSIMKRLKARIVIPMHWFGRHTLDQFLAAMADEFDVVQSGDNSITVSLKDLPARPTVLVLEPIFEGAYGFRDFDE